MGRRIWTALMLAATLTLAVHFALYDFIHEHDNATETQLQADVGAFIGAAAAPHQ